MRLPKRCAHFATHVTSSIERQDETNPRVDERLQRITNNLDDLKSHVAGRIACEMADDITEQLSGNDLQDL